MRWAELRRRYWQGLSTRVATGILAALIALAVGADCVASDLPMLLMYRGELYVLPSMTRPGALRPHDNHSLRRSFRAGDWAVFPPIPFGPSQTQAGGRLEISAGPGGEHPLGTDDVGRDVVSQMIHGARVSLLVGLVSVLLYLFVGLFLGLVAAWFRGATDAAVNWAVAVMMTFPTFLLVLTVQGLIGSQSLGGVMLIIGLTGWAGVTRLARGEALRVLASPFVEAARGVGASPARILVHHVLPHAMGPVLVAATFGVGAAILTEAALSFLGLGPDAPSWGRLLAAAQVNRSAWWLTVFPGLAIFVTVLACNFVAEGVQEALDPRGIERLAPPGETAR